MNFSVIIPTLNAQKYLSSCLKAVRQNGRNPEIIIADGGSTDETLLIAHREKTFTTQSAKGRGIQLNAGAKLATGDILLFLHADTLLPKEAFGILREWFSKPAVNVGTFRLRFDTHHPLLNFYGWMTQFDSILTRFGDQVIVVRKKFFENLGGFPEYPLFEDVAFFRKSRKTERIYSFPDFVTTSAEKFLKNGIIRQQMKNGWFLLRFLLGASPQTLYQKYYD